jgi:predicted membrane-bound mannosyltransferase
MLREYTKKTNIAAAVWICSVVAVFVALELASGQTVWDSPNRIPMPILLVNLGAYLYFFWSYAKAKGYWGLLGVVLSVFAVVGLIILVVLKDKHPLQK